MTTGNFKKTLLQLNVTTSNLTASLTESSYVFLPPPDGSHSVDNDKTKNYSVSLFTGLLKPHRTTGLYKYIGQYYWLA